MNWKSLMGWLVVFLGVYMYAQTYGMSPGWVPFTPMGLWNYTGVKTYNLELDNSKPFAKVIFKGNLSRGTAKAEIYKGSRLVARTKVFKGEIISTPLRYELKEGKYTVKLYLEDTDGYLFFDYVAVGKGW